MTSIPLLAETIEWKQFRFIYLKNKRFFLNFSLHFSNLMTLNFENDKYSLISKKDDAHSLCISEITDHEKPA